jgi:hypothetical protein
MAAMPVDTYNLNYCAFSAGSYANPDTQPAGRERLPGLGMRQPFDRPPKILDHAIPRGPPRDSDPRPRRRSQGCRAVRGSTGSWSQTGPWKRRRASRRIGGGLRRPSRCARTVVLRRGYRAERSGAAEPKSVTNRGSYGGTLFREIGERLDRSERWASLAVAKAERREIARVANRRLDFDGSSSPCASSRRRSSLTSDSISANAKATAPRFWHATIPSPASLRTRRQQNTWAASCMASASPTDRPKSLTPTSAPAGTSAGDSPGDERSGWWPPVRGCTSWAPLNCCSDAPGGASVLRTTRLR